MSSPEAPTGMSCLWRKALTALRCCGDWACFLKFTTWIPALEHTWNCAMRPVKPASEQAMHPTPHWGLQVVANQLCGTLSKCVDDIASGQNGRTSRHECLFSTYLQRGHKAVVQVLKWATSSRSSGVVPGAANPFSSSVQELRRRRVAGETGTAGDAFLDIQKTMLPQSPNVYGYIYVVVMRERM